ncbi:conserved hypothetical protein [Leishmania major strain Friedlin]|uniref:Uncharacterized protein n=1 Tax=Leishmania major TaxID=5664 RepID=Q4QAN7_LEIMA|nr:conserved hypothetical protein [Leishmania major strain Friedlin]CAG9574563.1 hypothetical_protein_-_conserved [Leishmania major strain Friedlin]CAJ04621.1 conserved hypothetical protein [Leishmania major strain Friedlin]|eukprot:XP_001683611.1 conserved hypothetical protein [Leishmania major strain Friedlin]
MLSPCAHRAALLDLLTSSAAESQEMENERAGLQADPMHVDPAQARHPYVPSLRLARRPSSSFVQEEERAVDNTTPGTFAAAAAAAAPSVHSYPPVAPVKGAAPISASHCVIEDSVLRLGNAQARSGAASSHGLFTAHEGVARQPTSGVTVVEEETGRSLILSFIDNCICAGVPEAVIAEQVQFIVSSMKESLALHAALHAQQHKDRIREYEVSELTAMLERQQLQFAQQHPQMAPPVLDAALSLSASSQILAASPSMSYAPLPQQQQHAPEVRSTAEWKVGAKPLHYMSISRRLSDDLCVASATTDKPPQHCADNGRPLPSSRRARSQAAHMVNDRDGSSSAVPVFSWRPRTPAHVSTTETPTAPVARSKENAGGGAAAVSSSTGHACAQPHTRSPPSRATSASHRSSRARDSSCHHHPRHSRYHKLCSVYYPSSPSSQPPSTPVAQAAEMAASPVDDRPASQRRSPMAEWRQWYTPSQRYMRPTHTSRARRESKPPSLSPSRINPPAVTRGLRDEGHVKRSSLRWGSSDNAALSTQGAASAVTGHRATVQKLLVRSTHSSRLRAAATSRRQTAPSVLASRASCESEDELNELGSPDTPHAQESVAPCAAAVADHSLRATPAQMPTSVVRVDPSSGPPPPSPSPGASNPNEPRRCARLSIDPESTLDTTGSTRGGGDGEVETSLNAAAVTNAAPTRGGSETPPACSAAPSPASSSMPAAAVSASTAQRSAPSQITCAAVQEGQPEHHHYLKGQKPRPHRPPPPPQPRSSSRDAGSALSLAASAAAVVDDDCSDASVCVTSPELQLFMELSQRQLRETKRVLAQVPTPSRTASVPHPCQSPSPMSIVDESHSGALRDRTAVSSCAPYSVDAQQTPLLAKSWSDRSLDAVRARQQQRLADLRRRFSSYDTASSDTISKSPHALPQRVTRAPLSASVVAEAPHDLQEFSSVIFQPHYVHSASVENSPLVQISPTSSDESMRDGCV